MSARLERNECRHQASGVAAGEGTWKDITLRILSDSGRFTEFDFEIDHMIAEKHGGQSTLENLCLACFYCNSYKGPNISGIDPTSDQIDPLYNPRQQQWNRHFQWDGPKLVGKTRSGRATVRVLNINHEFAIAVRQALIEEGVFPLRKG